MTDGGKAYDPSILPYREIELTEADIESYNRHGWRYFDPEIDLKLPIFPTLGPSQRFHENEPVVELFGKKYKIIWEEDYNYEPFVPDGKSLTFIPTDEPLSVPDSFFKYMRFFGEPRWIQGKHYVLDLLGNPCYHFLTIENDWGDSGNYNIQIGFDENKIPNFAYFEASCC